MKVNLVHKKVMITREKKQAQAFSKQIIQQGGIPIKTPLLKINCRYKEEDTAILESLNHYEWIFFTSTNGVNCFFEILSKYGIKRELLAKCKMAVVGHKTELALKEHGYSAHFIPTIYKASVMAQEFLLQYPTTGHVLLVRGSRSLNTLLEAFVHNNLSVQTLDVYETSFNYEIESHLNKQLGNNVDFVTFTSPSTVDAFIEMIDSNMSLDFICACIGPTTAERAKEHGFERIIIAEEFTIEGMIQRMNEFITKEG